MDFEFDPAKDQVNRDKHGLPLAFGMRVFDDPSLNLSPTIRLGDEEERWKATGRVDAKLYTVIYVDRRERVRLISVRRSNRSEQRDYDRHSSGSE